MSQSKSYHILESIPLEVNQKCQKLRRRLHKNGNLYEETNLPCGKRAKWSYEGVFYCVTCVKPIKEKIGKQVKKRPKTKAKKQIKATPVASLIKIPSERKELLEMARDLEDKLSQAKSINDFLKDLKRYGMTNREKLLKVIEQKSSSYSLAHLIRLEWKIK